MSGDPLEEAEGSGTEDAKPVSRYDEEGVDDKVKKLDEVRRETEDAPETCVRWMKDYNVKVGHSWGNMPAFLQVEWKALECDWYASEYKNVDLVAEK